nr:hypothetical protein L204_03163 [Cryptococcus depauperatus CBS 7855]
MGKFSKLMSGSSQTTSPPPPSYGEAKQERLPTPPPAFPHTFACLHLARGDGVRLIGLPETVYEDVEQAIIRVWMRGIQGKSHLQQGIEWKLRGYPWSAQGSDAVPARRLLCHILFALCAKGWEIHISVDLSKKEFDKDTIILHSVPPRERFFFSVSFNQSDRVRIIDPPDERVKQTFIYAIRTWPLGIQLEKEREPGCYELKLRGNPWWTSSGDQIIHARLLACTILSAMETCGFVLVSSVDMSVAYASGNSSAPGDLDTWFFASV